METFKSIDEILDFAIKREEEADQFYHKLAEKMERPEMRKVFEDFAKEEQGHKMKLELVKKGEYMMPETKDIMDMKISDYIVDAEVKSSLEYQDALILAMKKEKAAFRLYNDLSKATDNVELSKLFLQLAKEEARHKLRFEIEYDEYYLPEN